MIMKKIVKPHKVRKAPSSTGLAQYKGGKDKYQYPYESQLNVPVKVSGNKYNLSPRQLAGISDEYSSLVYDPKQYVEDFKMFGPDIFIDKDVERANEMLDNGYGFFEMSPLQEVVVTPDYDLMRKAQQIVPNKSLRTALYQLAEDYTKKHSSNYGVNRLLDLYQYAGKPSVQEVNTGIYSIIPSKFPNGKPRAFYNPSFDTMYLGRNQETLHQYGDSYNPSDLAAELAHPYHLKVSNKSPLRAITDAIFRGRADKKVNGKTAYQRHGDVEYQTHQIVQPEMRYYVDSEESLNNFNKRLLKKIKIDSKYKTGKDNHKYYDYILTQSMLGNPTAKRMTGEDNRYIPAFGQGDRSNLVIGSYGNYATPSVMNVGGELMYTPNPWAVFPGWMVHNQSFRFNNPNDAIDFAENYKYSSPAFPEFFGVDNSVNYNKGKDSGIHIKKANRGKFTAAAKRAGMGVQAYARKILSAPKGEYSPTLRRRAAFARNFAH